MPVPSHGRVVGKRGSAIRFNKRVKLGLKVGPLYSHHIDEIRPQDHASCIDSLGTGDKTLDELSFMENTSFTSEDSPWDFNGMVQTDGF